MDWKERERYMEKGNHQKWYKENESWKSKDYENIWKVWLTEQIRIRIT